MKYSFIILGLPRAGTHMLASALDSHPEIACRLKDNQVVYAPYTGRVWTRLEEIPYAKKYIVIHRPFVERMRSFRYTGFSHAYRPGSRPEEPRRARADFPDQDEELIEVAYQIKALQVHYSDLTGGLDCRQIPQGWSQIICDFLGVKRHILCPRTYKPSTP